MIRLHRCAVRPFARFGRLGLPAAVVLALTLLVAACGGSDSTPTATAPAATAPAAAATSAPATTAATTAATSAPAETTSVTLMLDWTPNNHHAGFYVARAEGWYAEAGLDVNIVEPAASGTDAVVGAGQAEFGVSVAESVIPARAAGVPIVSIATIMPHNDSSLMALASSGITRPKDLEGKTYGGYGGALEHQLIDQLVSCDGGDPSTIKFVDVGNVDYIAGMEQGRYDFVWVFEGWDALRARDVLHKDISTIKFIDHTDCIPDWYTPLIITSESMITDHPDEVRAFLDATTRGFQYAIDHPDETADMLLAAVPELDPALVKPAATYHAPLYADPGKPWGVQDPEIWSNFEQFLLKAGLIEQDVDVSKAFTNDFLPAPGG